MGKVFNNITDGLGLTNHSGDKALQAQTSAANAPNQTTKEMFDIQRADMEPWRRAGANALNQMSSNLDSHTRSFTMNDFMADPGYQFRMDEGVKALERSAAARGGLNSGAALKALTRFGQDFASNEYTNVYNRYNNDRDQKFNKLATLAGVGQTSASQMANAAGQYGQSVAQNQLGLGNAQAANQMAFANRGSNLFNQAASLGGMALLACDENLKTDIEPISRADLRELRKALKAYRFKYKDEKRGEGEWVGVMAQDLEKTKIGKSLVVTDEHGFKHIKAEKMLSMFLAAFAADGVK